MSCPLPGAIRWRAFLLRGSVLTTHTVGLYYSWSRREEAGAPLAVIENRFPTLFESRRMLYPHFDELRDAKLFDQSVEGFLDHILKRNFTAFAEQAASQTGHPVLELERADGEGRRSLIDETLLADLDTLIVISFDSLRTGQQVLPQELSAVRAFLAAPGKLVFVGLHHDIGNAGDVSDQERRRLQEADFNHHGDHTIPPQQRFSGFGRSLLAGLEVPIENRFGLRPARLTDGSPAPFELTTAHDRLGMLSGVSTFNLHPHLPHFVCLGSAVEKMEVLVRQPIDMNAPPHPFTAGGRSSFDALLQSRPGAFGGDLLVGDTTLWSSTAGGVDSLRRFWTNVVGRA